MRTGKPRLVAHWSLPAQCSIGKLCNCNKASRNAQLRLTLSTHLKLSVFWTNSLELITCKLSIVFQSWNI